LKADRGVGRKRKKEVYLGSGGKYTIKSITFQEKKTDPNRTTTRGGKEGR